jgi:HEPN domain-containing protein
MSDLEHARAMLAIAQRDLRALTGMKDPETFADEVFGFQAQQAVEKALKAWLSLKGVAYPWIHDLEVLLKLVKSTQEFVPGSFDSLTSLTDFAIEFRYEFIERVGGLMDRENLIQQVSAVIRHVEARVLEKETQK